MPPNQLTQGSRNLIAYYGVYCILNASSLCLMLWLHVTKARANYPVQIRT